MRGALEDTICAIATPVGEGGIGILRLSGPQSLVVAETVVKLRSGAPLQSMATHTLHLADLRIPSSWARENSIRIKVSPIIDEGLVVYMKGPRSFTGEDVVEIHSHGGGLILSSLCRACVVAGARLAEPGEFTKRAFLNGRLDLSQAEAVLDTIRAKSLAGLTVAQRQLRGELAKEVGAARQALVSLLSRLEAGIDFIEEDIAFMAPEELERVIAEVGVMIQRLQATAREGRLLRDGARVVIVGRPNVGKSSLLNRLLGEDRAIVTEFPGTTRDSIEESLDLGGLRAHVVDTAGIRDTVDAIELEGIRRSRAAQSEADLQLVVVDGSSPLSSDDRSLIESTRSSKHIVVINKADLGLQVSPAVVGYDANCVTISARTGGGIEDLKEAIRLQLVGPGGETKDGVMVTNVRHQTALMRAGDSLRQASKSIAEGFACELVALDVRAAADALGEITGEITTEEVLDQIFSEFCIGK